MSTTGSATVDFLMRLRAIDKQGLTVRDILVLYTVMSQPGMAGQDVSQALGYKNRSAIALCIDRLIRQGMIEDRRLVANKANPNILHVLPAGIQFWNDLKP